MIGLLELSKSSSKANPKLEKKREKKENKTQLPLPYRILLYL
jgi:hypothetical protein